MGASLLLHKTNTTDFKKAESEFEAMVEEADWSSGHEYSGDWNMMSGLTNKTNVTFKTEDEAEEYLCDKAEKWGDAIAVMIVDEQDQPLYILFGGWAAC